MLPRLALLPTLALSTSIFLSAITARAADPPESFAPTVVTVTGAVRDARGNPVADVTVRIERNAQPDNVLVAAVAADAAGDFMFPAIPVPARYTIIAVEEQHALTASAERMFSPSDAGQTVNVQLTLERPGGTRGSERKPFSTVRVHYATDRARGPTDDPLRFYENAEDPSHMLRYGIADVTIPDLHKLGSLETFGLNEYLHFTFRPDPAKHIIMGKPIERASDAFFADLRRDIAQRRGHQVVVYIHGFKTSFELAARTAAQIKYDLLPHDVAIVLYSWSSRASILGYAADRTASAKTADLLEQFLTDISVQSDGAPVSVIAHSMGNIALTRALNLVAARADLRAPILSQVILAAPDVPTDTLRASSCTLAKTARGLTLYASTNDQALLTAIVLEHAVPAGLARPLLIPLGVDSVDASTAVTDFVGHGYFSRNADIINDIAGVLSGSVPPRRFLVQRGSEPKMYWQFDPTRPESGAKPTAISHEPCPVR